MMTRLIDLLMHCGSSSSPPASSVHLDPHSPDQVHVDPLLFLVTPTPSFVCACASGMFKVTRLLNFFTFVPSRFYPSDQLLRDGSVFVHIELEPVKRQAGGGFIYRNLLASRDRVLGRGRRPRRKNHAFFGFCCSCKISSRIVCVQ